MAREYFCAYHSYLEVMEQLGDAERGRLFTACLLYSKTGEAPELTGNERFVWPSMREQIDRDAAKYHAMCDRQRKNISKRWDNGNDAKQRDTSDTTVYHRIPPYTTRYHSIPDDTNEKEKEKEKAKEKEKEKEKAKEKERTPSMDKSKRNNNVKPLKREYAEFVTLTEDEYAKLIARYGEAATLRMIEILDNYKGQSEKNRRRYSSDYRAILNWVVNRYQEEQEHHKRPLPKPEDPNRDDEEDWLRFYQEGWK